MTYAEREAIMSKDIITTAELARLLGTNESQASRTLQTIKRALKKRGDAPGGRKRQASHAGLLRSLQHRKEIREMIFSGNIYDIQREIKTLAEQYGGMDEDAHWVSILYKLDTNLKAFNNNIRRSAGLKEIER